jgi:hypothetical protein
MENFPLVIYNWRQGCIWISQPTYDVLRVETDLLAPVSKLQLTPDHLRVDYGPVKFDRDSQTLWLPWDAEMFMELRGKRYHHRDYLSDYWLFESTPLTRSATRKTLRPKIEARHRPP